MLSSGVGDTLTLLCSSTSNFKREIFIDKNSRNRILLQNTLGSQNQSFIPYAS